MDACQSSLEVWRRLYSAALLEADSAKLPERIIDAEIALLVRMQELFQLQGDSIEEQAALEDAMYALHALRSIVESQTRVESAQWAA